jgi:hydroxymethylpyrimidine/phosphomethylpyrimidine kinase
MAGLVPASRERHFGLGSWVAGPSPAMTKMGSGTQPSNIARVLVVAGSDSGAGAGIQADIKTIAALGGYATTAVTAITAQDTMGVHAVHMVPEAIVREQMVRVLADVGADAIKTGMLGPAATAAEVAAVLDQQAQNIPLVVDPVMVAKGGGALIDDEAIAVMTTRLFPLAAVVTPNASEAARLTGMAVADEDDLARAGAQLLDLGVRAALVKGGHLAGTTVSDALVTDEGAYYFRAERIDTRSTHGTGCTLASAIAAGLAQKMTLVDAVARAHAYVQEAIRAAPGLGRGHGPLNHFPKRR